MVSKVPLHQPSIPLLNLQLQLQTRLLLKWPLFPPRQQQRRARVQSLQQHCRSLHLRTRERPRRR